MTKKASGNKLSAKGQGTEHDWDTECHNFVELIV